MVFKRKIRYPKVESLGKLISSTSLNREDTSPTYFSQMEDRVKKTVSISDLRTLYSIDGLTFRETEMYVDRIVGPGFFFVGEDKYVKMCEEWSKKVYLKSVLKRAIRDIFIGGAGNAWLELGYTKDGRDIAGIRLIPPETEIDYIRDNLGNVILDEHGEPEGFVQGKYLIGGSKEWRKDKIVVDGKVVWKPRRPDEDGRDRIVHLAFYTFGEYSLGITPFQTVYKQAIMRLNIEHNLGESISRSNAILLRVGTDDDPNPPDQALEDALGQVKDLMFNDAIAVKRSVQISNLPTPEFKGKEDIIYMFADLQGAGVGRPIILDLQSTTRRGYAGEAEQKGIDFELTVEGLQEELAIQVREKILKRLFKARGIPLEHVPEIKFRTKSPVVERQRTLRLAALARRRLIRGTRLVEKRLRQELGLPVEDLDEQPYSGSTDVDTEVNVETNKEVET